MDRRGGVRRTRAVRLPPPAKLLQRPGARSPHGDGGRASTGIGKAHVRPRCRPDPLRPMRLLPPARWPRAVPAAELRRRPQACESDRGVDGKLHHAALAAGAGVRPLRRGATVERRADRDDPPLGDPGAPEGEASELPPPPHFDGGWQLGTPDLVVTLPEPYTVPPEGDGGKDVYRNFVVPIPLDAPRYVRSVELDPGNPHCVHHAFALFDRTRESRRLDERDPAPGFGGMDTGPGAGAPAGSSSAGSRARWPSPATPTRPGGSTAAPTS